MAKMSTDQIEMAFIMPYRPRMLDKDTKIVPMDYHARPGERLIRCVDTACINPPEVPFGLKFLLSR